jgi:hypothetical protein
MKEAKRKRVMYGVFIFAMLWGLYMQPWKRGQRNAPAPTPSESSEVASVAATVSGPAANLTVVDPGSEWPISPFRPSGLREPDEPEERPSGFPQEPVLQGTMTVRGVEVCVFDGQVCKTGDRRGLWKITGIEKGEVTLLGPNQERVILNSSQTDRGSEGP